MQRYVRDWNQKSYLFEVTDETLTKLKTARLLGLSELKVKSPCVLNERLRARGDFQKGELKFTAEYHGNDTWLIKMWSV
nr:MAG: hypothetical protein [Bacteriophage sp.]